MLMTTTLDDFSDGIEYMEPGFVTAMMNERQADISEWAAGTINYWADRHIALMRDIQADESLTDNELEAVLKFCDIMSDMLTAEAAYFKALIQTRH